MTAYTYDDFRRVLERLGFELVRRRGHETWRKVQVAHRLRPASSRALVVVFLGNGEQRSYRAAPLARNVLEVYYGLPLTPPPAELPEGPVDR